MKHLKSKVGIILGVLIVFALASAVLAQMLSVEYTVGGVQEEIDVVEEDESEDEEDIPKFAVAEHLQTPKPLKAIYMTSWVSGTPSIREGIISLIDETEINAVVIDIKDDTGRISYEVADPSVREVGSWENRIPDLRELIARLHRNNVYVIGRISVFQDPFYTEYRPELAVKRESDNEVWTDYKGLSFIDVGAQEYWKYIVALAHDSYEAGFDEINFDYIRFPSDGNMKDIRFPFSGDLIANNPQTGRAEALEKFFSYLYKEVSNSGAVISADLFGYTTTNRDDLGIGQVLERALPYFDYVMPMVYPSHYNPGFIGIENPAAHPAEVVQYSMESAVRRAQLLADASDLTSTTTAVTFLKEQSKKGHGNVSTNQLRPWLQDFDLGATYTSEMVRGQITATYDSGLDSWAMWDAANTYTTSALLSEE